jgi:cellobiose phosphorylase
MRPWDNYHNYLQAHWSEAEELIVASLTDPVRPWITFFAFAAMNPDPTAYDTDHEVFIGDGSLAAPAAVRGGECTGSDMPGDGRAVAAFSTHIDLEPGQQETVHLVVGFSPEAEERKRLRRSYLAPDRIEEEFRRLRQQWEKIFLQPRIETPDPRLDRMVNIWLKANVVHLTQSLREGIRGYRDTLQDAMGMVSFDPSRARELLVTSLSHQYADGHAVRQFAYDSRPHDLRVYNDSPLWIILSTARYLKETGEFSLLDEEAPFFESDEQGTVFDHVRRAADWVDQRRGWHDLIRVDRGDWCDGFDQAGWKGKGVSFWLSQAFHLALIEVSEICDLKGDGGAAAAYREKARELRNRVEEHGWDGEWYLWAISDSGRRLGTKGDPAMEIYINTQAWAVIGQTADRARADFALDSVDRLLDCRFGPLMMNPPFRSYDPDVGRLSVMPPGCGENGTVYVHAAVFHFLANLMARRPDRALEILRKIAPMMEEQDPEETRAAPYAYVNSYVGPSHPAHEGRTLTSWYTSSGSWTLFAVTDWLLGVRPTYQGLLIDPCLPASWRAASLRRAWRGANYRISITKEEGVTEGRVSLTVDGKPHPDQLIPPHADGASHHVVVQIAAA